MKQIEKIADIQNILFDSLCYFDDFCRENGIRYFLSNGTLLGAAKYGSFVPWDDDVDIILPREDYDRLVRMTNINNGSYRLLCAEQVPSWKRPYAKLSFEPTFIEEGDYDFGARFGLAVDIFPLDKWSPCVPVAKFQAFRGEILKRLLISSCDGGFSTKKRGVKKYILFLIWRSGKALGSERVMKKIAGSVERSKRYKKKYLGSVAWTCHLTKEVLPAKVFEETEYLSFCGRSFPVPSGYTEYLDSLYGPWREELPPEKQHSNHDVKVWWKDEE